MAVSFRRDIAEFLAQWAMDKKVTTTYGELSKEFGGILPRSWGPTLTEIAVRLKSQGFPMLPVIVVSKETGLPSLDAQIYRFKGILTDEDMLSEQKRCFDFDWRSSALLARVAKGQGKAIQ